MKRFLLLFLFFGATTLFAQGGFKPNNRFFEAGFIFGLTNYSGDLVEKTVHLGETHLGYGAFARYFAHPNIALRAQVCAGTLSGTDAHASNPQVAERSFRFSANLLEFGLTGEWHFLTHERLSKTGIHRFGVWPYVYAGAGVTFVTVETEFYGPKEIRKQYITTDIPENGPRQRFLIAPVGIGLRAEINERMGLGVEAGCRPVFSDYLDGVRLTGNPGSQDWYYFGGAMVSFVLSRPR